jgi:hypothetical protein
MSWIPIEHLVGKRYGFLAVEKDSTDTATPRKLICRCDCGALATVRYSNLQSGNTTSCGCQQYADRKTGRKAKRSYAEYKIWSGIKQRCLNPMDSNYPAYGGRGIVICDRWHLSFEHFLNDMGHRPSAKHSIDRKDNDGPYSPDNCRWATVEQQNRNRRDNHYIVAFGKAMILRDWARAVGLNEQTIFARLIAGWPTETALTAPKKRGPRPEIVGL